MLAYSQSVLLIYFLPTSDIFRYYRDLPLKCVDWIYVVGIGLLNTVMNR